MNKQRDENKMKLKRNLLLLVFMLTLALVLAACSAGRPNTAENSAASSSAGNPSTAASEAENGPEGSSAPEEQASADGDVLVAYFSHTGNTEEVAQQIADLTGGTLAEIQRAEEYGNLQEEAEAEILDGVHPEITVSAENVQDYDTIFVGYPIWWDEAPAMIATFRFLREDNRSFLHQRQRSYRQQPAYFHRALPGCRHRRGTDRQQ